MVTIFAVDARTDDIGVDVGTVDGEDCDIDACIDACLDAYIDAYIDACIDAFQVRKAQAFNRLCIPGDNRVHHLVELFPFASQYLRPLQRGDG